MADDEKYLELYKKYKPKSWSEIVGQPGIVRSLRSAVKANKIPVAYFFSGPRGTGKTSAAKVLAASLNCLDEKAQASGDACGVCDVCVNIQNEVQLGVRYESMASRGGVDEIRKIVDQARLAQPVRKTVFILDEVHNLSPAAWDSLLIPLESAKMATLFILCSTEAHKIPEPIMSRVQARKFSLVTDEVLKDYLQTIIDREGLEVEPMQFAAAVRLARGSVRDMLTKLEAILSTGEFEESIEETLLLAIQEADVLSVLKAVGIYADGGDKIRYLAEDLYSDLRDLLLLRTRGGEELVSGSPLQDTDAFKKKVPANQHLAMLDSIGDAVTSMSVGAADHRIILETALLKSVQRLKRAHRAAEEG